jgi:hypothetical protein
MSCRAAAARFGVAPSTAIRWQERRRTSGSIAPKPQCGDMRSRRVEARREDILTLWEARKDISLEELRAGLAEIGLAEIGLDVSVAGLHRFFARGADGAGWSDQRRRVRLENGRFPPTGRPLRDALTRKNGAQKRT